MCNIILQVYFNKALKNIFSPSKGGANCEIGAEVILSNNKTKPE